MLDLNIFILVLTFYLLLLFLLDIDSDSSPPFFQAQQSHMSAVAVCFVTADISVSLMTLTTSVPVTGTAMNRPARPCLLRQISGSMWLSGNKQWFCFVTKIADVNTEKLCVHFTNVLFIFRKTLASHQFPFTEVRLFSSASIYSNLQVMVFNAYFAFCRSLVSSWFPRTSLCQISRGDSQICCWFR